MAPIDSIDSQRVLLHARLGKGGCMPSCSPTHPGSDRAESRDAVRPLVVVEDGTHAWNQLSAVCGVIGMPERRFYGQFRDCHWIGAGSTALGSNSVTGAFVVVPIAVPRVF